MAIAVAVATRDKTIEADTSESRHQIYFGTIKVPAYAAAAASCTLTSDAIMPLDGDQVILGAKTYTFRTALSSPAVINEVLIGVSAATALDNIALAVDKGSTEGTQYSTGTTANATISSSTNADTTQIFTADTAGIAGNLLMSRSTSAHLSFAFPNLTGGLAATTYGAGGYALSFAGVCPHRNVPVEVNVWSETIADGGYRFWYIPGADVASGKLVVLNNAGTSAGPLVELADGNTPAAISSDVRLRFKARFVTGS